MEILARMTVQELLIAYLRSQGLYDAEIGEMLQVSRVTVATHMHRARRRLAAEMPELAVALAGRHRMRGLRARRVERGAPGSGGAA